MIIILTNIEFIIRLQNSIIYISWWSNFHSNPFWTYFLCMTVLYFRWMWHVLSEYVTEVLFFFTFFIEANRAVAGVMRKVGMRWKQLTTTICNETIEQNFPANGFTGKPSNSLFCIATISLFLSYSHSPIINIESSQQFSFIYWIISLSLMYYFHE